MVTSFLSLICAQGVYTSACSNAIRATIIQSGFDSYISDKTREVNGFGFNLIGKEFVTFFGVGASVYRFSSGRQICKKIKSPISDGIEVKFSKNYNLIEFSWEL